jgi:hypothetical protein
MLRKIQSFPEFKIDTPVNKVILGNIDVLLKLENSKKEALNLVLSQVKLKIKTLLLPQNFTKFHQQLHTYRVKEFLQLCNSERSLPSCDNILWQCILDAIVKKKNLISLT